LKKPLIFQDVDASDLKKIVVTSSPILGVFLLMRMPLYKPMIGDKPSGRAFRIEYRCSRGEEPLSIIESKGKKLIVPVRNDP
jgi:hypothetical protein